MAESMTQEQLEKQWAFVGFTEDDGEDSSGDSADTFDYSDEPEVVEPVPPKGIVRDPENLLKLYKDTQAEKKRLEKSLKAFGELTPAEVAELKQAKAESQAAKAQAEEARLKTEGQYAQLYDQKLKGETEKYQKELTQREKRIQSQDAQVQSIQKELEALKDTIKAKAIKDSVSNAFFSNGGKRGDSESGANEYLDTLWGRYSGRFNLTDEGNLEVLDDSGELAVDGEGKPLGLQGFISQVKTKGAMRSMFDGLTPSGNDTPQGGKRPRVSSGSQGEVRVINPKDLTRLGSLGISLEDVSSGRVIVRPDAPPATR